MSKIRIGTHPVIKDTRVKFRDSDGYIAVGTVESIDANADNLTVDYFGKTKRVSVSDLVGIL
jgi:hypothetical protein